MRARARVGVSLYLRTFARPPSAPQLPATPPFHLDYQLLGKKKEKGKEEIIRKNRRGGFKRLRNSWDCGATQEFEVVAILSFPKKKKKKRGRG